MTTDTKLAAVYALLVLAAGLSFWLQLDPISRIALRWAMGG